MGYDAYSYAAFGVKTSEDAITKIVTKRACNHTILAGSKFCHECGRPANTEKREVLLNAMKDKVISYFPTDSGCSGDIVVGFKLARADENNNPVAIKFPSTQDDLKEQLLTFFKEHELPFTEKDIQLYILTYHSY